MIFEMVTLTLKVDLLNRKLTRTMTFESEGLLIVAIYIWLPPARYVVFLTTLVFILYRFSFKTFYWGYGSGTGRKYIYLHFT